MPDVALGTGDQSRLAAKCAKTSGHVPATDFSSNLRTGTPGTQGHPHRESRARAARRNFDTSGHYARPDVFSLTAGRSPKHLVTFG
ncbi:hypothetical protein NBRC116599_37350 [Aquicoccus sp. SU-CL01552]